jgi:phosphoribosyl-ATP pyrophosphohydrolase/phosphoribosyl-AMP cyclohydrolase
MLIPSIDLIGGRAVQMVGGRDVVLERDDVRALAEQFRVFGDIAVIDIDAARGTGDNSAIVEDLCGIARCRVGGGVRSVGKAEQLIRSGASRVVVGTAAGEALLGALPAGKMLVAVDFEDGKVLERGWTSSTREAPLDRIRRFEGLCSGFLVTDVSREGRMCGFDAGLVSELRAAARSELVYAGGVSTPSEVAGLDGMAVHAQVGMALYSGLIDPCSAFLGCLDFGESGILPCIVQDRQGRVRMLAWQTPESLRLALEERKGVYYSRSRRSAWRKGETSGNTQDLVRVDVDCDRDALLFTVDCAGPACHTGSASCFGEIGFALGDLHELVCRRMAVPEAGSYTSSLLSDCRLLGDKILEEAGEVVEASSGDDLVWEAADLLYFLMVRMAGGGVTMERVLAELGRRRSSR